jgi:hypothetical protein
MFNEPTPFLICKPGGFMRIVKKHLIVARIIPITLFWVKIDSILLRQSELIDHNHNTDTWAFLMHNQPTISTKWVHERKRIKELVN